jgi:hypothetical protein
MKELSFLFALLVSGAEACTGGRGNRDVKISRPGTFERWNSLDRYKLIGDVVF